jgi:hypothetical protein
MFFVSWLSFIINLPVFAGVLMAKVIGSVSHNRAAVCRWAPPRSRLNERASRAV